MLDKTLQSKRGQEIFNERSVYGRWVLIEVMLAQVQAELKIIPSHAAIAITDHVKLENLDFSQLENDFKQVGFPIVGLVRQLTKMVPDDLGQYIHWGATTQDIMDTGMILALVDIANLVDETLIEISNNLSNLAKIHGETLISGRSQLQQAVPVTLGYKIAGWVLALDRHQNRLAEMRPRLLQVQFGGAVGTMVAVHPNGPSIRKGLAKKLGLKDSPICWHTHRDTLVELTNFFGLLTGTLAKISTDITLMAQTEIGEINEPASKDRGISSTMPQKRNPVLSQQIIVAARLTRGITASMMDTMVQDHERGTGSWQSEWTLLPEACCYVLGALENMAEIAKGIEVDKNRMMHNITLSKDFVYAEAVMMKLAYELGRQISHDLIEDAVSRTAKGMTFKDALLEIPEISNILTRNDLDALFSGEQHCAAGNAATKVALSLRKS